VSYMPEQLVNLALVAVIALPVVLLFTLVWAVHRIVRPLWAIVSQLQHLSRVSSAPESVTATRNAAGGVPGPTVVPSMFGR
jgi:nitrate/nitrite-specific signal transduction histidine kinase